MVIWDDIRQSAPDVFSLRSEARRGLAWPVIGMMLCALSAGISGLLLGFLVGLAF